ncbi:SEC-C domain-containing protein [Desulfovibrio sp. OttesenSCG-928-A18]|nr:SEC-C domain-containing protein [Desulfovibrio sp. OttesenSCG-928-A18]
MQDNVQEPAAAGPEEGGHGACYCGSGREYSACCGPIISGDSPARTPEELMRARFSAHCLRNYTFLVDSTHPEKREGVSEEEISKWASHVNWTGLEVHSATPGESDDEGVVSFTAHFTIKDTPQELREDAFFIRLDGAWTYVDGDVYGQEPFRREGPRVGRNDPCPCGSGKKFKKCCGA